MDPALEGPYDPINNGRDAYGHKVNGYGRCQFINQDPSNCPQVTNTPNPGDTETIWDMEAEPDGRD